MLYVMLIAFYWYIEVKFAEKVSNVLYRVSIPLIIFGAFYLGILEGIIGRCFGKLFENKTG
jgi:hypothetical protein